MIAALAIGFVGSLHCMGMCGPLALYVTGSQKSSALFIRYHGGRLLSYMILGALLGWVGYSVQLLHAQQVMTFTLGTLLLVLYAFPRFRGGVEKFYYQSRFYHFVKQKLSKSMSTRKRWITSGIANGFLPCGLTYVAAASAVATGDLLDSVLFMFLFGLGTIPAMLTLSLGGSFFSERLKELMPNAMSLVAILSGCVLILRGLLISSPNFNQMVQTKAAGLITVCGL